MTEPDKLLVFDYSGTLSLEAPRVGRADRLARALADTGLADLGVATPAVFWEKLVNPTWTEGSTTRRGYKRVIAERIAALGIAPGAAGETIAAAASRFVDDYLAHSTIDPRWQPVLADLRREPSVVTVIATDHYAEATAAIGGFLKKLGIDLFVANSADLGAWKGELRFWEALQTRLPLAGIRRVLLIDDFGFQEEQGDRYGGREQVPARQEKTLALLRQVFGDEVESVPFFLEVRLRGDKQAEDLLIAAAAARIAAFLGRG